MIYTFKCGDVPTFEKNNQSTKSILFIGDLTKTFIKNDYQILKNNYNVTHFSSLNSSILYYISRVFFLTTKNDIIFCWFANWDSFFAVLFAKILKKKSIVVIGGYDCAYEPEINYGAFTNLKEIIPSYFVLKNASLLLAVSKFTKKKILERVKTKKDIKVVYNGIDQSKFNLKSGKKEKIIVTIGQATKKSYKLKGLDVFAKVSLAFPEYKFIIIGKKDEIIVNKLKEINPNLIFTGKIPHEKVIEILHKSLVYCQLSYMESFGVGLVEAINSGCIPVVTKKGALPETVGDGGLFVAYGNVEFTINVIKEAISDPDNLPNKVINEKINNYSLKNRLAELTNSLDSILTN